MAWLGERGSCAAEPYQWLFSERSPALQGRKWRVCANVMGAVLASRLPEECMCVVGHRKSQVRTVSDRITLSYSCSDHGVQ